MLNLARCTKALGISYEGNLCLAVAVRASLLVVSTRLQRLQDPQRGTGVRGALFGEIV